MVANLKIKLYSGGSDVSMAPVHVFYCESLRVAMNRPGRRVLITMGAE